MEKVYIILGMIVFWLSFFIIMLFISYIIWIKAIPRPIRVFIMDFVGIIEVIFAGKEKLLVINKGIQITERNPEIYRKLAGNGIFVRTFKKIVKYKMKKYVKEEKDKS